MNSYEEILQRMEEAYEQKSGCKVADVSEVGLRMRVLAGELYRLETSLDWLERQAFPQTASGEQLDLHGAQRGVTRGEAEKATGVVSFSRYLPLSLDLVVPKGTVCATSGEPVVEYQTTEDAVLVSGQLTVDIPVEAVVAGASGNAAAGYVTTLVNAPVGINYAANETAITGGKDPEDDDASRAICRCLFPGDPRFHVHVPAPVRTGSHGRLALGQHGELPGQEGQGHALCAAARARVGHRCTSLGEVLLFLRRQVQGAVLDMAAHLLVQLLIVLQKIHPLGAVGLCPQGKAQMGGMVCRCHLRFLLKVVFQIRSGNALQPGPREAQGIPLRKTARVGIHGHPGHRFVPLPGQMGGQQLVQFTGGLFLGDPQQPTQHDGKAALLIFQKHPPHARSGQQRFHRSGGKAVLVNGKPP